MAKQNKNTSYSPLTIIVAAIAVLFIVLFIQNQYKPNEPVTPPAVLLKTEIDNEEDLAEAESEMDGVNLDEIDTELKGLDSDSSDF